MLARSRLRSSVPLRALCSLGSFVALVLVFATSMIGCGDRARKVADEEPALSLELHPTRLVLTPSVEHSTIDVVNTGTRPLIVGDFVIQGQDWASFGLDDALDRQPLLPGQTLTLHIRVDPKSFQGPQATIPSIVAGDPRPPLSAGEYREGGALLRF